MLSTFVVALAAQSGLVGLSRKKTDQARYEYIRRSLPLSQDIMPYNYKVNLEEVERTCQDSSSYETASFTLPFSPRPPLPFSFSPPFCSPPHPEAGNSLWGMLLC